MNDVTTREQEILEAVRKGESHTFEEPADVRVIGQLLRQHLLHQVDPKESSVRMSIEGHLIGLVPGAKVKPA